MPWRDFAQGYGVMMQRGGLQEGKCDRISPLFLLPPSCYEQKPDTDSTVGATGRPDRRCKVLQHLQCLQYSRDWQDLQDW